MREVTPEEDSEEVVDETPDENTEEAPDETPDEATAEAVTEMPACLCPLTGVLELLSKKYAMQIVCAVGILEPVRYRELSDQLGDVSSSTLSTRLKELTESGILAREQYDEIPPRVEYRLTEDGEELAERLEPIVEWAQGR